MPETTREPRDHQEGFEREARFHLVLALARRENPILMARTIKTILFHVAPDFLEGLFEPRPCVRRLRYVGCGCEDAVCTDGPPFFRLGEVYESFDFTGATYGIKGYTEGEDGRRIGHAYFDWIDDEDDGVPGGTPGA